MLGVGTRSSQPTKKMPQRVNKSGGIGDSRKHPKDISSLPGLLECAVPMQMTCSFRIQSSFAGAKEFIALSFTFHLQCCWGSLVEARRSLQGKYILVWGLDKGGIYLSSRGRPRECREEAGKRVCK